MGKPFIGPFSAEVCYLDNCLFHICSSSLLLSLHRTVLIVQCVQVYVCLNGRLENEEEYTSLMIPNSQRRHSVIL